MAGLTDRPSNRRFLMFALNSRRCNVSVLGIRRVHNCSRMAQVTGAPTFVGNIAGLHNIVIPVISLQVGFDRISISCGSGAMIVILGLKRQIINVIISNISSILSLATRRVHPTPRFTIALSARCLAKLNTLNSQVLVLIGVRGLLGDRRVTLLSDTTSRITWFSQFPRLG